MNTLGRPVQGGDGAGWQVGGTLFSNLYFHVFLLVVRQVSGGRDLPKRFERPLSQYHRSSPYASHCSRVRCVSADVTRPRCTGTLYSQPLPTPGSVYSTKQYNFIARCQYNCTRDVLWCKVHSSHIHTTES